MTDKELTDKLISQIEAISKKLQIHVIEFDEIAKDFGVIAKALKKREDEKQKVFKNGKKGNKKNKKKKTT